MLDPTAVDSGYGETQVLYGLSLSARAGRVLAILGRNGAWKSTTLKTIMGLLPLKSGSVTFDGKPMPARPIDVAKTGIAYVPETRDIFRPLSVRENLALAAKRFGGPGADWTMGRVLDLFPRLGERLDTGGTQPSGGGQQMLAIARALLMNPRLLILDEPTEGLAPIIAKLIHDKLQELQGRGPVHGHRGAEFRLRHLACRRRRGDRQGQVVWTGSAADIRADEDAQHTWLGV